MPDQRPTQRDRTIAFLRAEDAVCSTTLLKDYIPRGATIIHRLRRAGWLIETRPCSRVGHDHATPQIEYRLTAVPSDNEVRPRSVPAELEVPNINVEEDGQLALEVSP